MHPSLLSPRCSFRQAMLSPEGIFLLLSHLLYQERVWSLGILFVCLSVYLFIYQPIHPSTHLATQPNATRTKPHERNNNSPDSCGSHCQIRKYSTYSVLREAALWLESAVMGCEYDDGVVGAIIPCVEGAVEAGEEECWLIFCRRNGDGGLSC